MTLIETFDSYGLSELRRWTMTQQLPLMYERSVRLQPNVVECRRALFSLPITELRPNAINEVLQICEAMSSPDHLCSAIRRFFGAAEFVHFGFECSGQTIIGKCYLELPRHVHNSRNQPASRLVFLGYKWSITDTTVAVVSRYRQMPITSWQQLVDHFLQNVPQHLRAAMLNFLQYFEPASAQQLSELRLLQVSDEGSERLSYDLNVYNCQKSVRDVLNRIRNVCRELPCEEANVNEWACRNSAAIVGHVSAGQNRHGQPFVTIYHGADLKSEVSAQSP